MRREGSEFVYSSDDGFDSTDEITRLETPDEPFA